ncbi:helix-turn-helix domain-containing protein [Actinomadura rayongensis]|uniref:Helix-turn-helix domain-containing protein n=1 Tax=Actinomadura rayongensis TaxID=1429076 RepID=A0A6I4W782_9ACTN|nr:helix-turn-helix domain-containing protein [Actinomadura rayongensis]
MTEKPEQPILYTPAEVAQLLRVDPKTVTRWAKTGTLRPVTLPSGHRRYHADEIHRLLDLGRFPAPPDASPYARAILHAVVHTYFGGDTDAAVQALRPD